MRSEGRRIHIAGSASTDTPAELLRYAHAVIAGLVTALANRGARFVVGVGKEPRIDDDDPSSPSIIFDWTVLATLSDGITSGTIGGSRAQGRLITTLATDKTARQVPEARQGLWQGLLDADAVELRYSDPGWTSGAIRRAQLARLGDVFVALSGGEGVEHLARLYAQAGKPVIPLDLALGASSDDGSGGAARLAGRARANPAGFIHLSDLQASGALFANIATHGGDRPVPDVIDGVLKLLEAIAPPAAFYVRLLDQKAAEFAAVEQFFRNVVDPVVTAFGYEPMEMGRDIVAHAWMNQAIFDKLHHAQMVIVDVTGTRPNCFMEMGYAFGREIPVLITAMSGTHPPFDATMIEHYSWSPDATDSDRQADFREYWLRNFDRPTLVLPREVL